MGRYKNMLTAEKFNRKIDECIEYQKLTILKDSLKWFNGRVGDMDVTILEKHVYDKLKEIPKESLDFDKEVHGDRTNL